MVFITDLIFEDFGTSNNLDASLNSTFIYDNTDGFSSVNFHITVPTSGTVQFEGTNDSTNWFTINFQNINTGKPNSTTSSNNDYTGSILGLRKFRVKVTSAGMSSGSVIGRTIREGFGTTVDSNTQDQNNPTYVQLTGPVSAFGENLVGQLIPRVQISFPYNLNSRLVKTEVTNSGTVTHDTNFAVCQTNTTANGSATLNSIQVVTYRPGIGVSIRFTAIFNAGNANNKTYIGLGNSANGLFIGYNGTLFGVLRRNGGVDTWVYQDDWNNDKLDGTGPSQMILDKTKGNVYQIKFQWLGFGQMTFYVENPDTGNFITIHRIQYANANTVPSLANPSFPFIMTTVNSGGSTTNNTIKSPSVAILYEGATNQTGLLNSKSNEISPGAIGIKKAIIAVNNKLSVFGGSNNNNSYLDLKNVSFANNGTQSVKFGLILNPTSITSATYADVDTNTSIAEFSINGTTITGGREIFTVVLAPGATIIKDFNVLIIDINPGENITAFAEAFQNTNGSLQGSMTWGEII